MRRVWEWGLLAAALLLAAAFLSSVVGWKAGAGKGSGAAAPGNPYFHAGKAASAGTADPACQASGCHAAFPHGKDPGTAPFRNLHQGAVRCLACHGQEAQRGWTVLEGRGEKLGYSPPGGKGPGTDPHALIGPPLACRKCHSESGRSELAGKGMKGLPQGFANPIALRMMEEGARRWVPDTMR